MVGKVLLLDLGKREKMILTVLAWHADDAGRSCYPSIPRIMKMSSCGERAVQRSLLVLSGAGLVTVTEGGGRHNTNDYALHIGEGTTMDLPAKPRHQRRGIEDGNPVTGGRETPSFVAGNPVTSDAETPSPVTGEESVKNKEPRTEKEGDSLSFSERVFGTAAIRGSNENGQVRATPSRRRTRRGDPAYTPAFEELWAIRRKGGKRDAFKAFVELVPAEVSLETAKQKLREYVAHLEGFAGKNLSTWLNKQGWEEDHTKVDPEPAYRPPTTYREPGVESASAIMERMDPKTQADMERMQEEGAEMLKERPWAKNRPKGGLDERAENT